MTPGTLAAIGLLAASLACAPRGPVLDTGSRPPDVGGTIAGTVRASGGSVSLANRIVTAIDDATGTRVEASTAVNGGYTMKVPVGTYRLEVELKAGEALETRPGPTEVSAGDLDPDRDFVVTVAAARPSP